MADDIDIEEHDILENPRFKDILADCAIKTEPLELNTEEYEDPSQNYQDYEYYQAPDYPELEESSYQEYGEMSTDSYAETLTHSVDATFQNRIILGTKPCSQSVSPIIGTSNSQDPIILNTQGSVIFGTKPSPKLRKAGELDAQAPIILNTQGSVDFGAKACPKSRKTGLLSTSQDGIVRNSTSFGTKPCPKSRKTSQSQMVFNPMVFGTKLCPVTRKPMIEDTGSYGVPFADNSLIIGTKPCPKSRKPQLTSTNSNTQELSTFEVETGPNKINLMATESSDYSDFERNSESNLCQNSGTDTISDPEKSHPLLRYLLDKGAKDPAPIAPKPIRVLEDAIVVLENWGPRLQTSQCYCDQCGTLFATRNALDFHNMTAHSFLVAMDEPVAEETPQKHEKFCNQCHTYFTDDNLLIQHLYEHLTASTTATVEPEKLFYKCPICFSYYASHTRFVKHTLRNHNTTFEDVKLVNFRTFCNICSKKTTVMSHNKHIQEVHKSYYVRKVKTDDKKALNKAKEVGSERKGPIKLSIKRNQSGKLILKVLPKVGKVIPKVGKVIPKVGPGGKLLKFKNVNVGNIPLTRRNNVATYKCTKCKLFYASRKGVLTHINKKHPSEKTLVQVTGRPATGRQPTGRPMTGRLPVSKNKGTGERGTNQFDFYKSKVPKDVVFKCKTCHVHLLCSIAIHMHESKCMKYKIERTKSKNIYDCKKCGNTFRNVDRAIHDEQHLRANRIKIYEITDNFYARLLYKCEGCNVFFEEKRFLKHCAEDCHYEPSEWCPKCKINVDSASRHEYRHASDNLSRSDFILIDQFIAIDKSSTQQKMSLPTVSTSKSVSSPPKTGALKRKLVSEDPNTGKRAKVPVKLYYCTLCRNFSKLLTWRNYHVTKACLTQKVAGKNCVYCGLPFRAGMPIRRHQDDHRIYKWKFSDFAFHNMNGETPITPPIPMFPTCKRCGVHYTGDVHDCRSEKRNCSICKRKFNAPAYKLHQLHHKYLENETETIDDVTELIQKYESLKSTWNIIYYCSECDVATDAYDRAVEHAQKHIASCLSEHDRATCDICCINFDSASIAKHEELHTNENIDKSSFNILTYNYTEFLTDKWFDLFRNLSQAEIKQITFSSVYVTRFVKMNLILNGPLEFTLYKCECCKNYVKPSNVYNHTRVCDEGRRQRAYPCEVCTIPFSSANGLNQHKTIHQNTDVTANSYRIVSFNAKADKDFNTKLEVEPEIEKQNIKFTFLRCSKCNCCSSKGEFFRAHNCSPKVTFLWSCGACPFVTKASHAKAHEKWHRENRNIKSHEIDFIRFGGSECSETEGNEIPPNKLFVWFQCQRCEVLISSCPKRHECSANPLRTCPKCEYKFSLKSYSFHMYEHERTKDLNRDTIHVIPLKSSGYDGNEVTSNKLGISIAETSVEPDNFDDEEDMTNLDLSTDLFRSDTCDEEGIAFKCSCGLHFTSEQAIAKHKEICSPTQTVLSENCTKCGLLYPRDVFLSHFCNREGSTDTRCHKLIKCYECRCLFPSIAEFSDHGRKKLCDDSKGARCEGCGLVFHESTIARHRTTHAAPDDSYKNNNRIVTLHVKTSLTLYKCKKCNIHLMEEVSYRRHLQLCMKKTLDYCCTDCGLHFPLKSKYKHIWAHHTVSEMTAQDFIIYHKDKGVEHLKTYLKDTKDLDSSSGDRNGELIVPDAIEPISDNSSEVRRPKFKNYTYNNICYDCNLYKCCCGLYYFSKELFEAHSESDHTEKKEWCSKCGFVFTPDLLIEHTKVHHDRMGLETEDFVVFTKEDGRFSLKRKREVASDPAQSNCVYECGSCQLHFTNAQSTITHLRNCGENKLEEDCSKCGLKFSSTCLVKHRTLHHGDLNYGLDDIHIFIVSKYQEVVDKASSSDSILDKSLNMNDSVSNISVKFEDSDFEKTSPSSTCAKTNEGKSFKHAIYKCEKCRVYFLSRTSIYNHLFRDHDRGPHHPCKLCGFKFTFKSLLSHQKMHHRKGCSINVYNIRQSGKKFKCTVCGESFMHLATLLSHFESGIHSTEQRVFLSAESDIDQKSVKNTSVSEDNTESDKISPSYTSADRANIDDSIDEFTSEVDKPSEDTLTCNDVSAVTQSNDSDVPATNKPLKIEAKSSVVRLYKCGECNVFFMNQATCSKHVMYQHTVMDSKEYIECKLCSLPFRIMSLARHIKMHHKSDFELSKVLVEEYHPKKEGEQTPKIDIYYAIDKVQSRLVSTTTEDERVDGKSNRVTQSNIEDSLSDSVIPTDSIKREIASIEDKDNIVDSNESDLGQCDKAKSINSEKARATSESNIHLVPERDGAPSSSLVNKTNVPERESNSLNLKKSATTISSDSVQNDVFEISTVTQIKLELIENE